MIALARFLADAATPLQSVLSARPPAGLLVVGFSVLLVLALLVAEEVEQRRSGEARG